MASVRLAQQDDALAICHNILACQSFEELAPRALSCLTDYFNAETSVVIEFYHDGNDFRLGRSARHELPAQAVQDYGKHYVGYDPVIRRNFASDGRALTIPGRYQLANLSEISEENQLVESCYYNEFLRPQHIHHVMAMFFRPSIENVRVYGFGFHRPRAGIHFTEDEITKAGQIAPALFATLNGITMTERLREQQDVLKGLSRATDNMEVMIIDHALMLCYANDRAQATFNITDRQGHVSRQGHASSALFSQILDLCLHVARSGADVTGLRHSLNDNYSNNGNAGNGHSGVGFSGEDRLITIKPFEDGDGHRKYLVTISSSQFESALERKVDLLGMTRRETDIIRLVAAGATNPQIAEQLFLSTRTVENHLRSIFSKASVHSRTQLVRMLLSDGDHMMS